MDIIINSVNVLQYYFASGPTENVCILSLENVFRIKSFIIILK